MNIESFPLTCSICLCELTRDNKALPCTHTYHSDCVASLAQTIEESDLTEYIIEQEALHLLEEEDEWEEEGDGNGDGEEESDQQQEEDNVDESADDVDDQQGGESDGSVIFYPDDEGQQQEEGERNEDGEGGNGWGNWTDEEEAVMVEVERAVRFMVRDNNLIDIRSRKRIICPDCRREYIVRVDELPVNIWVNRLLDMKKMRRQQDLYIIQTLEDLEQSLCQDESWDVPSPVAASFKEWKAEVVEAINYCLPAVKGLGLSGTFDVNDAYNYATQLREEARYYTSLFVYKIVYERYCATMNAMRLTACVMQMNKTLEVMKVDKHTERMIATQFQHTAQEAIRALDSIEFPLIQKVDWKGRCLNSIGSRFHALGEYSSAIQKYKDLIQLFETLQHPEHYHVYGIAQFNIGSAYYNLRNYPEAVKHLNLSLEAKAAAVDFSTNIGKRHSLMLTRKWLRHAQEKLALQEQQQVHVVRVGLEF